MVSPLTQLTKGIFMALITCKDCSKEVSTDAKSCPNCGAKVPQKTSLLVKILAVVFGIGILSAIFGGGSSSSSSASPAIQTTKASSPVQAKASPPSPPSKAPIIDDNLTPTIVIAKYGKPDKNTSSAYEKPRPPIVTRFMEYKKEGVRFVFVPDAPINTPPPYSGWKLIAPQDMKTLKRLPYPEAEQRMTGRLKKG